MVSARSPRKPRKPNVITGWRLGTLQRPKRLIKPRKAGGYKRRSRLTRVEIESYVISPRGREITEAGEPIPTARPLAFMPQTPQDYFLLSRAIMNMAYDIKSSTLEIQFTTGHVYQYYNVPYERWIGLKNSASKGRYFHKYIYGKWVGPKGSKLYIPNYTYRRIN